MKRSLMLAAAALACFAARPGAAQEITLATAPPVVVQSAPRAGSDDVDPGLAEIKVTFSKDMADKSWSWAQFSEGTFPKMEKTPRYEDDKRTAVLPVKLEPGRTYALWINSQKFRNFKDVDGTPAVPYLLVFKTKK